MNPAAFPDHRSKTQDKICDKRQVLVEMKFVRWKREEGITSVV